MKFELTWHGPVQDVYYAVEADTEDEAIQRLQIWLCEPDDEGNSEGIEEIDGEI